ncbi:MarR family transcriptional regulator [Ktedonobacter sp. SOSP1-85]|uniref:MarR family transcriptional regulator n=1 Tax=Ktedonobacter robiniae TaxID=2778365 RepID=A0ABQ3UY01_9CHLR|nr:MULTISPECIES: MarR family transcriptional regulator [Ktedonobacter]GHO57245.1 MarR family transcriptional regulator [Ktedonobacter robiniae]GHO78905.1 MarR family transcriptional regulator [Ktedonobacter sp. SOSP1-85]
MTPSTSPEEALKLDNQLCFALYAATRAMMSTYRGLLEQLGLTFPQYLVMLVLWEVGPSTVKDLGQTLYLDSGTLSPLLKRLEAAGLIHRTRSARDERAVEISLTEAGQALKEQAFPVPGQFNCRVGLEASEFAHLRGQLRDLAETLTLSNELSTTQSCTPEQIG